MDEDGVIQVVEWMNTNTVAGGESSRFNASSKLPDCIFGQSCCPEPLRIERIDVYGFVLIELRRVEVVRENVLGRNAGERSALSPQHPTRCRYLREVFLCQKWHRGELVHAFLCRKNGEPQVPNRF